MGGTSGGAIASLSYHAAKRLIEVADYLVAGLRVQGLANNSLSEHSSQHKTSF